MEVLVCEVYGWFDGLYEIYLYCKNAFYFKCVLLYVGNSHFLFETFQSEQGKVVRHKISGKHVTIVKSFACLNAIVKNNTFSYLKKLTTVHIFFFKKKANYTYPNNVSDSFYLD